MTRPRRWACGARAKRYTRRMRHLALAFVAAILFPSKADAGGPSLAPSTSASASPNVKAAARQAFAEGIKLFEDGDYGGALTKFNEAHALVPLSAVRFNVARCQDKLGRTATAWAEYKATAADAKNEGKAKLEAQALEAASAIEPRVPYLRVSASPTDAVVKIDGETVANDVSVPVDPGTRVVTVTKGPKSKKLTVTIADGQKNKVVVAL